MVFLLSQWSLLRRMKSHVIDSRAPNFFAQPPPVTAGAREDTFKAKWTPRGPGGPFVLLEDELSRGDWKVSLSRAPDSPTQRRAYQDKSIGCAINQLLSGALHTLYCFDVLCAASGGDSSTCGFTTLIGEP